MRRPTTFGVAALLVGLCIAACENDAATGGDSIDGGGAVEDAPPLPEASPGDAEPDTGDDAAPARPWGFGKSCSTCSAGTKQCGLRCVALDDIRFGCADPTCGPPLPLYATTGVTCAGGKLTPRCVAGFTDCDGSPATGCEAMLDSPETCGTCGNACAAGQVCDLGVCKAQCTFPRTNCQLKIDAVTPKGACRDLSTSTLACGSCTGYCGDYATSCTDAKCGGGLCPAGTHSCPNLRCVADDDPTFCGGCQARELREGELRAPCAGTTPAVTCMPGFETCPAVCGVDLTGAPTCGADGCTATATDRLNCGACGNTCAADQRCEAGACKDAAPETLAGGLTGLVELVLGASDVYVAGPTTITRVSKAGGAPVTVVEDPKKVGGFSFDATHVYWGSVLGGAVLRAPLAGGAPEVMFTATSPNRVMLDESTVTFGDQVGVFRGPKAKGAVVQLKPGRVEVLAQSNSMILTLGNGRLELFDKTSNAAVPSLTVQEAHNVVAVAEAGFFHVTQHFYYPTPQVNWGFRMPSGRGYPVMSTTAAPKAMTSDGCALYYALDGSIARFKPLASTTDRLTAATVVALAVDETHVYWTDGTAVKRVLK